MASILTPRVLRRGLEVSLATSLVAFLGILLYRGNYQDFFGSLSRLRPGWILVGFAVSSMDWLAGGLRHWVIDPSLAGRAEVIREKGTNRSRFFRGQVDKYTWVDIGSSYLPSDILAAFLYAQFEQRERIQEHRKNIWDLYCAGLQDWGEAHNVRLPFVPEHCDQAYHMFYLLLPGLELRQRFIAYQRERGIYIVFHYLPLHLSEMGKKFGGREGDFPVSERMSDCLVRLPFHNGLTSEEQEQVIKAICDFPF